MSLKEKFIFNFIDDGRWHYIVDGLKVTLEVTFFAVLLGIALGVIIAIVRSTYDKNKSSMRGFSKFIVVLLNFICKIYLTVIRGTPVVVQLMIMYFIVLVSSNNKVLVAASTPRRMLRKSSAAALCPLMRGSLRQGAALASIMCRPCAISSFRRRSKTYCLHWQMNLLCC